MEQRGSDTNREFIPPFFVRLTAPFREAFRHTRAKGILSALASAVFLGMTPIFGKKAILLGVAPLAVVAIRTILAALLLLLVIAIFHRKYLFIYPAGLLGCLLAGWVNGLGSLFFYSALGRIGAGVGQLLYSLYPLFVAMIMMLDHNKPSRMTIIRLGIAIPAAFLITQASTGGIDIIGVLQMLLAAFLYALHLPINQRVLYEMPAPTVTLYTLFAMSAIVVPTYIFSGSGPFPDTWTMWTPMIALTLVTFFSRLTLFLGVKNIGGLQTALLGLSELVVTLVIAHFWLGETYSVYQWIGAGLLVISLLLVGWDKGTPRGTHRVSGLFAWLTAPNLPGDLPWQPDR